MLETVMKNLLISEELFAGLENIENFVHTQTKSQ